MLIEIMGVPDGADIVLLTSLRVRSVIVGILCWDAETVSRGRGWKTPRKAVVAVVIVGIRHSDRRCSWFVTVRLEVRSCPRR